MSGIKRIDLPPDNEQSVYTRMISERESTAQDYLSRGDAQAKYYPGRNGQGS